MATGNLLFRLKHKEKMSLAILMDSFNHMACELQKSEKAREDFVSNVSHEIQSPLTSIRGFTKAIRDDVIPPEHQKEYLNIIYQESLRFHTSAKTYCGWHLWIQSTTRFNQTCTN